MIDISSKTKRSNVTNIATDTEVRIVLDDFLLPDTYRKFSPVMCGNVPLDGSQNEKLQLEGLTYIKRNEEEMKMLAKVPSQEKGISQKIRDWIKLNTDMYGGLPFFSKL